MLVDNAIVVAEAVQWRLDHGEAGLMAGAGAVRELAVPLAGASGYRGLESPVSGRVGA